MVVNLDYGKEATVGLVGPGRWSRSMRPPASGQAGGDRVELRLPPAVGGWSASDNDAASVTARRGS